MKRTAGQLLSRRSTAGLGSRSLGLTSQWKSQSSFVSQKSFASSGISETILSSSKRSSYDVIITSRCYTTASAPQADFPGISAEQAKKNIKQYDVVIDVREPDEVAKGVIEGSKHVTLGRVFRDMNTEELQALKGKKLLLYCRSGARSGHACRALKNAGFDVTNLEGGWNAWSKN